MSRSEGGQESVFPTIEGADQSLEERYRESLYEHFLIPMRILTDDIRAKFSLATFTLYLLAGTIGILVIPFPELNQGPRYLQPFTEMRFPLGTNRLGQDVFGLVVHSTPAMLKMMASGAIFSTGMAIVVGTVSGFKGGRIDSVLTLIADTVLTIPGLPLIIVISVLFQPRNPFVVGIFLSVNRWAGLSRAIRSEVLSIRELSFVEASRTMGMPTWRILFVDVIPNMMPYIMVNFVRSARGILFASVGLFFLGILPFTNLNWGIMLSNAYGSGALYTLDLAHVLLAPMIAIIWISLALIMFAQATDKIFNPRLRARYASEEDEGEGIAPATAE